MRQVSEIIQKIIAEMDRRKMDRGRLAELAVEHMVNRYNDAIDAGVPKAELPRASDSQETVMRMLRGETEGGAYLIDACLAVLGLEVRRQPAKKRG